MAETIDPRMLDRRTHDRYLINGQLDEKVWEKHLKTLPDVAEKSTLLETVMQDSEDASED